LVTKAPSLVPLCRVVVVTQLRLYQSFFFLELPNIIQAPKPLSQDEKADAKENRKRKKKLVKWQYNGRSRCINHPTQRQQQATLKQIKTAKTTPKLPN
jgi:hypothetical protein